MWEESDNPTKKFFYGIMFKACLIVRRLFIANRLIVINYLYDIIYV